MFTIIIITLFAAIGLVTASPVLNSPSRVAVAAPATTTDPNNVPGPMFCAPECQNIYDVCIGDHEKPEKECRDMSCVLWAYEVSLWIESGMRRNTADGLGVQCSECMLCKQRD
ncbi:hypothetical protein IQ06DRAFT_305978 [Phaeosphaeriaceae sp. SRC1lsM3a]|nr:hypothetical protein IQ06DRAFT_305978 [Stagonospora sp. SRC1lsM3a]